MTDRQSSLLIIYTAVAVFNIGVGMIIPILPLYAQSYGASTLVIGLMISALTVGRLVMQGPGGYLADIHQAQKVAAIGIALFVPSTLLMAFLPHPYLFVALRFIEGFGEGLILPALYAIITTKSDPQKLGTAFGTFTSFAAAGLAIGPAFGGFLVDLAGARSPFLITAILATAVAIFISKLPGAKLDEKPDTHQPQEQIGFLEAIRNLVTGENALVLMPANLFSFLTKFAFASLLVVLPLYLAEHLNLSEEGVGLVFTANFIVFSFGQLVAGWLSDRLQTQYDVIISGLVVGVAFVALSLAPSLQVFVGILAIEAFAAAWVTVGLRRLVGQHIDTADRGKAYGIVGSVGDLGELIGPLIAGISYQWRPAWPFLFVGLIALLSALLPILLQRKPFLPRRQRRPEVS